MASARPRIAALNSFGALVVRLPVLSTELYAIARLPTLASKELVNAEILVTAVL